jgi:MoaA/NifB/PqqE/SkfB family radical SAM enzyme
MYSDLKKYILSHIEIDIDEYMDTLSFKNMIADLFISNRCQLKCKHCYFGKTQNHKQELTLDQWMRSIDRLYLLGFRHFHISGRESSLYDNISMIIHHIKCYDDVNVGIVSNGMGKLDFYSDLLSNDLDYLEFSIDGMKIENENMRGYDTFTRIDSILHGLSKYSDKINLATCLSKANANSCLDIITHFKRLGIQKFFFVPFEVCGNANCIEDQSLSIDELAKISQNIYNYLSTNPREGLSIRLCVPEYYNGAILHNEYFKQHLNAYLDGTESLVFNIQGNAFQLSLNLLNIDYASNLSITNDGYIISCSSDISDERYYEHCLGNILELNNSDLVSLRYNEIYTQLNNLILEKDEEKNF